MPQSKKVPFWRSLQTKFAMTYILIVAAVLILLNTYPVMVSQDLAYRSKETSMQNQAAVLASALATGPEALTAEGAARTVAQVRVSAASRPQRSFRFMSLMSFLVGRCSVTTYRREGGGGNPQNLPELERGHWY